MGVNGDRRLGAVTKQIRDQDWSLAKTWRPRRGKKEQKGTERGTDPEAVAWPPVLAV